MMKWVGLLLVLLICACSTAVAVVTDDDKGYFSGSDIDLEDLVAGMVFAQTNNRSYADALRSYEEADKFLAARKTLPKVQTQQSRRR